MMAAAACGPSVASFPRVGGLAEGAGEWYCTVAAVDVRCGLAAASGTRAGTGAGLALDGRRLFVRFSPALPCDSPRAFCSAAFAAYAREICATVFGLASTGT
jgi:hypothetical protein